MRGVLPALSDEVVAIDGNISRRSGGIEATALHLVSAFAVGAGLVPGQRGTAEKSNEKTAIPELLSTLALEGATVTIDAMGTQANIAEAIRARGADYVLAVKDNQPKLAESNKAFWSSFIAHPAAETPHGFFESVVKGHGRVETRRCYVFDQLNCLSKPEQWPGLKSFDVTRLLSSQQSVQYLFLFTNPSRCVHLRPVTAHLLWPPVRLTCRWHDRTSNRNTLLTIATAP